MTDFKNIDKKDIVFLNKELSDKEEKEFSAFLKSRKSSVKQPTSLKTVVQ